MSLDGFVQDALAQGVESLLERNDFIEILRISSVPGACSLDVAKQLSEFFNRDDNIATLFHRLFTEPEDYVKISPNYKEYAVNYNAYTVLCVPRFSSGMCRTMFGGTYMPSESRNVVLAKFMQLRPLDPFLAEAFRRFFDLCIGMCSPREMLESCGKYGSEFLHALTYQSCAASNLQSLLPSFLKATPDDPRVYRHFGTFGWQILQQLFPQYCLAPAQVREENEFLDRIRLDAQVFMKRMLMDQTESLVLDFIHELDTSEDTNALTLLLKNSKNMSQALVRQLLMHPDLTLALSRGIVEDLTFLPKEGLRHQSAGLNVVMALLARYPCHCVGKVEEDLMSDDDTRSRGCTRPALFNVLLRDAIAPMLEHLHTLDCRYSELHIQMIDFLGALIRYECLAVDRLILKADIMKPLVRAMRTFENANVLQAAIYRVFRMAFEDVLVEGPHGHKQAKPESKSSDSNATKFTSNTKIRSKRKPQDVLRCGLLEDGEIIDSIMNHVRESDIPGFVDIALSLDRAFKIHVTFPATVVDAWTEFRTTELSDRRQQWDTSENFEDLPENVVHGVDFHQDVDDIDKVMEEERVRKQQAQEALELEQKARTAQAAAEAEIEAEEEAAAKALAEEAEVVVQDDNERETIVEGEEVVPDDQSHEESCQNQQED